MKLHLNQCLDVVRPRYHTDRLLLDANGIAGTFREDELPRIREIFAAKGYEIDLIVEIESMRHEDPQ